MTLYVVRHGETYFNQFDQFQGWSDTPLTPTGIQQIQNLAIQLKALPITAVYASDMTRARQTASILSHHTDWQTGNVRFKSDLREHFYGSFEGQKMAPVWERIANDHGCQTYDDLVMQFNVDQAQDWLSQADPSHLAETSQAFWARMTTGLANIVNERPDQSAALLVSHSSVIRAIVARYAPEQLDPITPDNGRVTQLKLSRGATGGVAVEVVNYNQSAVTA
ncbi:histidine phosphatase family protein [Lactiplantibacillus garii]|nr:histidine phosphatase family protein [Lactiplantibacillus garii]